jgi:hypothetical protein
MWKSLALCTLLSLFTFAIHAVGPELPVLQKYTACSSTGIVTTTYDQDFPVPSCPTGYEERTLKMYVNSQVGSIALVFPDSVSMPSTLDCVLASGMLVAPCHGDDQPICLISHVAPDLTCSPEEFKDAVKKIEEEGAKREAEKALS